MKEYGDSKVVRAFTLKPDSIRSAREAYKMTVAQFAKYVGVSAAKIASWESGATRPTGTLEERALDQVMDEAQARFPDLKIELELNPEVAASRQGSNP